MVQIITMKKKAIIYSFCLFLLVNTIHGQGKIERIKTFEGKENQFEKDKLDAENKLNADKPGHEANKIIWENKAEEIRVNHGIKQHLITVCSTSDHHQFKNLLTKIMVILKQQIVPSYSFLMQSIFKL